jgi:hypothetical protein
MIFASIRARCCPMQFLPPAENGINEKLSFSRGYSHLLKLKVNGSSKYFEFKLVPTFYKLTYQPLIIIYIIKYPS